MSNEVVISNSKKILRRFVNEELSSMTSILNDALPPGRKLYFDPDNKQPRKEIELLSELLLNSPYADPASPVGDFPFVAGAINEIENGPVDVPGYDYFFESRYTTQNAHPLDALVPPFKERGWPFVLERYVTSTSDAAISKLGKVANIFDWEEQNMMSTGASFGMRLCYVPDENTIANVDFQALIKAIKPGLDYSEKAYSDIYRYCIPLVSVEEPIIGSSYKASLYNTVDANGSSYAQRLLCKIIETTEYKLLFDYAFPLPKYMSLLAIYSANTFVPSLARVEDGWAATPFEHKGGGQWIGFGKFGGMRTWRGNEGMKNTFPKTKLMLRQMLETSCNTNYLYKDRDEMSLSESFVETTKSMNQSDVGIKWWQWSSLRPAPCKKG